MDVSSAIPFHRSRVARYFERWMLGQPFVINQMELLLESRHASFEMYFQPSSIVHGIKLHTLRHRSTLIDAGNHIGEALRVASREIVGATRGAVVIGQVAGAERILTNMIVDGCLLLCVRRFSLHYNRFDQCLEILSPKLRALRGSLIERNLLGYADKLQILQRDDLMFHVLSIYR